MKNVAHIRQQIEQALADRASSPLTARVRANTKFVSCDISAVNDLLRGGLPVGVITEFAGSESSGRTTVALAYMATITRSESVCAWIDVADALDPESVAASGLDLERLLWVRCGANTQSRVSALQVIVPSDGPLVSTSNSGFTQTVRGGGSPHPRSEGRDMPQAIGALLQAHGGLYDKQSRRKKRSIGTPGAPNRPVSQRSPDREEQVAFDRLPARRGEQIASSHRASRETFATPIHRKSNTPARSVNSPWQAIDQALRATDFLLQAGGFSAIVLDLGSTPAEFAWRIPLATWFRFRAACERTQVSLLLLTQHPCARSSAELVVRMEAGNMEFRGEVMTGIRYRAEVERQRSHQRESNVVSIRKPPQAERPGQWIGKAAWAQGQ